MLPKSIQGFATEAVSKVVVSRRLVRKDLKANLAEKSGKVVTTAEISRAANIPRNKERKFLPKVRKQMFVGVNTTPSVAAADIPAD